MSEPRTFASLGPTLLARKGGAKPAMRTQMGNAALVQAAQMMEADLEDLGWNDMGEEGLHQAEIVALNPANAGKFDESDEADAHPEFHRAPARNAPARQARPRQRAADQGRRAAFTLRLDDERHLKLRLASTIQNRSAQHLLTEALDMLLAEIPEIDALAAQLKREAN